MNKRLKTGVFVICAIILITFGVQADNIIKVYVNGTRVDTDGILINDKTYVPLRVVSETMGADVKWDGKTNSAFVEFSEDDAVARLVSEVSPSVVTIVGNYSGSGTASQYNNPTMHGTGIIYKTNGYIITNAHVVEDIKNLTIVLSNGEICPGKVLFSDSNADLAIVKIEKIGLPAITMADKEQITSVKTAIAIGTPISLSMRNTVTKGIISGVDVVVDGSYYKLIQTDAAINPGNSGGPLINIKGQMIGINSSKFASVGIDNMGFAIPVDTVLYIINQYEANGKILRPKLNFTLVQSWEAKIGLPTDKGITVKMSTNPVLQDDDIIISVNGYKVHSIADWNEAIKESYNGSMIFVKFVRNGVTQEQYIEI